MIVDDNLIKRINELYHKSKAEGLNEEEKAEQEMLRRAYIDSFKRNIRSNLENISIVEPDGTITEVKSKRAGSDEKLN